MNLDKSVTREVRKPASLAITNRVRSLLGIALALLVASPAFAQYGGGMGATGNAPGGGGYVPPKGGYSAGTGVAVAAGAAAGIGIMYWAMHNRSALTGCVQSGGDGLTIVDEKSQRTFSLEPGAQDLRAGERVTLKGKKTKDASGAQAFQVRSIVRNLGECHTDAALGSTHSAGK